MNDFIVLLRRRIVALLQLVLVFGIAAAVLLYMLGYYDFSFIDRTINSYKDKYSLLYEGEDINGQGSFADTLVSLANLTEAETPAETETAPEEEETEAAEDVREIPDFVLGAETTSVKAAFTAERLGNTTGEHIDIGSLRSFMILKSDEYVPHSTILALDSDFPIKPKTYSLSARKVSGFKIVYPDDDSAMYTVATEKTQNTPALEPYMGYIIADYGDRKYLVSDTGKRLVLFDEAHYTKAFERDSSGKPLFIYTDDEGKTSYMTFDDMSHSFVESDYNPKLSRGLKFDYPATYGTGDSTAVSVDMYGSYYGYIVKDAEGVKKGNLTQYNYTSAFPFTSNRGAVTTKNKRGGMFFVDENGQQAFTTVKCYYNEYDRYVEENLMPPLTDGIESIGFYYFDHGLTRVRKQIIDWWNWYYRSRLRVVTDENILIRPDGSVYELPVGYTLEGYSEGMILLSKNDRYGFIDYTGGWIAQPIYTKATPFIQGLATLTTEDGRVGMIDTEGNIILQFAYKYISSVSSGLVTAYSSTDGWQIFRLVKEQ